MDDVTLRVLWDRFVSLVNEASRVLYRSAFSTLVRESNDFACSLLTTTGETVAIADAALPSFATTQAYTLTKCLELFPLDTWRPGDVVITNDPWIGTAQVMDVTVLAPVFLNGRPVAFMGAVAHSPDLGGVQRWNAAVDVFEEGIHIPPTYLYRGGEPNETLLALLRANSRRPDQTLGDLTAQLASLDAGGQRLLEIMRDHGLDALDPATDEIFRRSEQAMRRAVEELPDGEYRFAFRADGYRGPLERVSHSSGAATPLEVATRVVVEGSQIVVDFGESSLQVEAAINSVFPYTFAYSAYALRLLLIPNVPQNSGSLRPLRIEAREGTIFNAVFPAATLNRAVTGHICCEGIFGALADVLPDRVQAMTGSTPVWLLILIGAERDGRPYQRIVPMNGGHGAREGVDGEIVGFPHNLSNVEIETLESTTPVICERKEVIPDSAGPGRFRGGFGVRSVLRPLAPTVFALSFNRIHHPPLGLLGGEPGRPGRVRLNARELEPDDEGIISPGDTLTVETPGGGGIGPPRERDRERVTRDVAEQLVSPEHALEAYGAEVGTEARP
jgi:N-methylhydantoinase B